MTNATVAQVTSAPDGDVLHVTYRGKTTEIEVAPGTPIVGYVPGGPSLLKPGAAIFAIALKKPDGTLEARRITAEKNGIKPPM